jgi:amino acid/amide ABC transporter substrate-binding protein, HAAT family (TC 3.A.1.4.-)
MKRLLFAGLAAAGLGLFAPAAVQAEITIAVAGPMTGGEATFGAQLKAGAEMAINDINAKGGVLGQKLKLEIADDACDPKQAKAVAEKLAGMKVPFVAGHFCSGSSIPASPFIMMKASCRFRRPRPTPNTPTSAPGRSVSASAAVTTSRAAWPGAYLAKNFAGKNVAIVDDKSAYGKGPGG